MELTTKPWQTAAALRQNTSPLREFILMHNLSILPRQRRDLGVKEQYFLPGFQFTPLQHSSNTFCWLSLGVLKAR